MNKSEHKFFTFVVSSMWSAAGVLVTLAIKHRLDFGNFGDHGDYGELLALGIVCGLIALASTVELAGEEA
jgi:hypothetical protein